MDQSETKETKLSDVIMLEDDLVVINEIKYRVIENHDDGFDREKIAERYNGVLDRYDYIVGDWGYDQLRFKGFYLDKRIESNVDNKISHLEDYLLEYCNFGCAYFILERVDKLPLTKPKRHKQHSKRGHNTRNQKTTHKPERRNAQHKGNNSHKTTHKKANNQSNKTNKPANSHNKANSQKNETNKPTGNQNKQTKGKQETVKKDNNKPTRRSHSNNSNNKHRPRIRKRQNQVDKKSTDQSNQSKPKRSNQKPANKTFKIRKIDK